MNDPLEPCECSFCTQTYHLDPCKKLTLQEIIERNIRNIKRSMLHDKSKNTQERFNEYLKAEYEKLKAVKEETL